MKIYNKKLKYYKRENSLDIFLRVFKDLYPKVGIKPEEYRNAFSIILAGEANKFYYQKLIEKNLSFNQIIKIIRSNFEIKKRRNRILN